MGKLNIAEVQGDIGLLLRMLRAVQTVSEAAEGWAKSERASAEAVAAAQVAKAEAATLATAVAAQQAGLAELKATAAQVVADARVVAASTVTAAEAEANSVVEAAKERAATDKRLVGTAKKELEELDAKRAAMLQEIATIEAARDKARGDLSKLLS